VSEFAGRIVVVGTGYVGLTAGACLASLGHRVPCADVDEAKVERLRDGQINIREPGLAEMIAETMPAGRLSFVVRAATALDELEREGALMEVLFVCVPTRIGQALLSPGPGWDGSCLPKDTSALLQLSASVDFEFRLLRAMIETNTRQSQRIVEKIRLAVAGRRTGSLARKRITLLGLAFTAGTSDLRDPPSPSPPCCARPAPSCRLRPRCPRRGRGAGCGSADRRRRPVRGREGRRRSRRPHRMAEFRELDWRRLTGVVRRPLVLDTRKPRRPRHPAPRGLRVDRARRAPRLPAPDASVGGTGRGC
jgi:UDP-glucose/GDP-mannose dehydrogenase family, NAD binding domain/UDP-glucose/GDP-mannose dehydrogenase family, central domain